MKSPENLNSELLAKSVVKLMKKDIFERFMKTREITDEDWEFCEQIDWHPVDELPPRPEHVEELKRAVKESVGKTYSSASEFFHDLKK